MPPHSPVTFMKKREIRATGLALLIAGLALACGEPRGGADDDVASTWKGAAEEVSYPAFASVQLGQKFGHLNEAGELAIPAEFDGVGAFSEGMAPVKIEDEWGYIDTTGTVVVTPEYLRALPFSHGLAPVADLWGWKFIDRTGAQAFERVFESANPFSEGLAAVKWRGKWGYVDTTGRMVVPPRYE